MSTYQPNLSTRQIEEIGRMLASDRLKIVDAIQNPAIPSTSFYSRYVKRCLDVMVSLIALSITLPINIIIAIVTYFDVGSPIFFKQIRTGKDGREFTIIKFRNMKNTVDSSGELLPPEQRVTKWGRFVRSTSLDELLNFLSILKGDMSLIGPRPLPPIYMERYSRRHRARLAVRPGLECPPRHLGAEVWTWNDQLENDVWYVENLSFKTDCIMLKNLFRFATDKKSANARAVAKRGSFMGYDLEGTAINDAQIPEKYIDAVVKQIDNEHKDCHES